MLVIVSEDFCSCSEIPVVVRKSLSLEIFAGCCCYCSPIPEARQGGARLEWAPSSDRCQAGLSFCSRMNK
jgi:hypothetical protein